MEITRRTRYSSQDLWAMFDLVEESHKIIEGQTSFNPGYVKGLLEQLRHYDFTLATRAKEGLRKMYEPFESSGDIIGGLKDTNSSDLQGLIEALRPYEKTSAPVRRRVAQLEHIYQQMSD